MNQLFFTNILYLKRYLFLSISGSLIFTFSFFVFHANGVTSKCQTSFSSAEGEFESFRRQPGKRAINRMKRKNRWLRLRDSRPEFNDREAYTDWLIEKQKTGKLPKNLYGYYLKETLEPLPRGWVRVRHKLVPRIAPAWINATRLLANDPKTWRQYMEWAEEYYKKSSSYPPGYLNHIKDQIRFLMFRPAGNLLGGGGFKEDRRLKDVDFSLGGQRTEEINSTNSELVSLIINLKGEDKWLDGGTGFGFVLEDAILGLNRAGRMIEDIPYTLGITYHPKLTDLKDIESLNVNGISYESGHRTRLPEAVSGKHQIWSERLFQDIPILELMPRSKLITDFFGVYSYSSDPASVINKYLNILQKGGTIGIAYNNEDVVKVGEIDIPIHEWFRSVTNGQVSIEHGKSWIRSPAATDADKKGYIQIGYMLIRNPSGRSIELPGLEMIDAGKGMAAGRVFRPTADIIHL